MTTRKYSSRSQQTTLTTSITSTATSATVVSGSALLGGITVSAGEKFTVVIDPDTALEEIVDVTAVSSNTLTIVRGVDGSGTEGVSGQAHSAGAIVRHMVIGRDLREANTHIEASTAVHGLASGVAVVGDTKEQTLTNKTINAANNTITGITSAMIADGTIVNADISASAAIAYSKLALTGAITSNDIANDTIVNADINTAAAIDKTKIAGTAVTLADVGTVTGTMIASNTIVDADISPSAAIARSKIATPTADVSYGGFKITNLGTPTSTTDASTKGYVDTSISNLVNGAPAALDTLNEIAAAINNSGSFAGSVVLRDGTQAMTGALAMGANKITGLADPTTAQDAVTKNYLDNTVLAPSNLTGPITSVGNVTSVASQTGTGSTFVMSAGPTFSGNVIMNNVTASSAGAAAALYSNINGGSLTVGSGVTSGSVSIAGSNSLSGTVNIAAGGGTTSRTVNIGTGTTGGTTTINIGSTAGATNAVTIAGTSIPASKTLVVTTDKLNVHAATTSAELGSVITDKSGSGVFVLNSSPSLYNPKIQQVINAQTGTTYTLVLADHGKYITANNASAITITIPTNASVAFQVGASIDLIQIGAGQVTVQGAGGVTVYSTGATAATPKTRVQYSAITLKKIDTDTWHAIGDIA